METLNTLLAERIQLVNQIYVDYMLELSDKRKQVLADALFNIRQMHRWFHVSTDNQLESIWREIRQSEVLTDYLLHGTMVYELRSASNAAVNESVLADLAAAWSIHSNACQIDTQLQQRCPTRNQAMNFLKNNAWLRFLLLHVFSRQSM